MNDDFLSSQRGNVMDPVFEKEVKVPNLPYLTGGIMTIIRPDVCKETTRATLYLPKTEMLCVQEWFMAVCRPPY